MSTERKRTDFKNAFRVLTQVGGRGLWVLDPLDPYYPFEGRVWRDKKDKEILEARLSWMKEVRAKHQVLIFTTPHPPNFVTFVDVPLPEEFKAELEKENNDPRT